jgi:hypothetical protein
VTDDRARRVRQVQVDSAKLALSEDVVVQEMSAFEELLVREAALRVLFPAEAGDPRRSRAQRRWLAGFDLEEVVAGAERAIESDPWRATWD